MDNAAVAAAGAWTVRGDAVEVRERLRRWLAADDGEVAPLVVETSGSTGRPKRVVLTRTAVLASVAASADRLGATGPWVLALPPAYVAGLQVLVRSLVAGHEPSMLERDGWPAGDGWFVSLVPTQLRRALEPGAAADLAALRRAHTVLLGGGPVGDLRERAAEAGVHAVATYGSAETAGGCVYDGVPLDGVRLAVGEQGRLRVAGPMLFSGYDGDPALSAEVLREGWFVTSDAARIDDDGRLHVLGRVDDVVVTGGLNVPAPAVAERLRDHPQVRAVEVLGVPDDEWGHRLVAVVEPVDAAAPPALDDLRAWVASTHPRPWAPRGLVVLDVLPLLANGKPDRVALQRIAAAAP